MQFWYRWGDKTAVLAEAQTVMLFCFLEGFAGSDVRLSDCWAVDLNWLFQHSCSILTSVCKRKMQFKQTSHPDWPYCKTNIYPGKYLKNATLETVTEWIIKSPEWGIVPLVNWGIINKNHCIVLWAPNLFIQESPLYQQVGCFQACLVNVPFYLFQFVGITCMVLVQE